MILYSMDKVNVRKARREDMSFFMAMAAEEGWNPGINDGEAFFEADPKGFVIAEIEGKPIGCISAVSYGNYGFIGLFIVEKSHRGSLVGRLLGQKALSMLQNQNIGVDGVLAKISAYELFGFHTCHRNIRYSLHTDPLGGLQPTSRPILGGTLRGAEKASFDAILAYDIKRFGYDRKEFLKKWLFLPHHRALVWEEDGSIAGLGVIRKCGTGYKIGPLYSKSNEIADCLFRALIEPLAEGPVFLDILEGNQQANFLVEKYKMVKVFETIRMYTEGQPDALWNEVVGITSFELG